MTISRQIDRLCAIEALLDAERELLLEGEFSDLAEVSEQKERLIKTIVPRPQDEQTFARIHAKAKRNDRLFSASQAGIQSAVARLEALRCEQGSLNTYDKSGQRVSVNIDRNRALERKA